MPRLLPAPSRSFDGLVRAVREALIQGQAAADRAHLLSYHRTGHYIAAHLLAHRERADFGAHVVRKLAAALPADLRLLYRCLRFYRAFPIVADRPQLAWAHYRVLIDVADKAQRDALVREALEKNWTSPELEQRVRLLNAIDVTPPPAAAGTQPRLLKPRRGTPGVCRVIEVAGVPALDLGFACYRDLPARSPLAPGDFARVTAGDLARVDDATKADLYTYRATILRVVDGDTLWVRVDLEPGRWVKQKLRLRDVDCPEIATPAGRAAKRFTEARVTQARGVTICTTKPDKYDRYLADVFLNLADEVGAESAEEIFLNNELLAAGHAAVKREWEFGDWEG